MHRNQPSRNRAKRRNRSKIITLHKLYSRDVYFSRAIGIFVFSAEKSCLSCSIAFNANYSKICHSFARVSLSIAGSAAGSVNLVIMSCIFLTKLRGSSGRAKWLRLEQRPFNYFAARTSTVYTHTHMDRVSAHAYAATVYVRSHLVAGIAKVRLLTQVTVSAYTCPPSLLKLRASRKLLP